MTQDFRKGANADTPDAGPFLAKVVSHLDPSYMGSLEVQLLHESGNDEDREGQLRTVKYMSPFYGSTSAAYLSEDPDTHDSTQKAYGMWFVPPDVGTIVVCIFIGGDTRKGYWFGCVQDEDMNFSIPGFASSQYSVGSSRKTDKEKARAPLSEYNKIIHPEVQSDTTKKLKPEHPQAVALEKQGLLKDDIRGITTSSARREVPSMVFGISTPGPVDKTGKQGKVGKHEHKIPNAYVSRLGGSSFVMDDGDDKFLRKKKAHEGPPEYAAVEQGETGGIKDILHNELIRFRTRTGHQILMHNSEDLIYISNSRGTAWVELTSDGKVEIYAEDSISLRTKQDFNLFCDRDFNLEVGRNFNTKVHGEMHTHVIKDQILIVDENQKIHIKKDVDKTYDKTYKHLVKEDVNVVHQKNYTHTVFNSVNENYAGQGGVVKTTAGGNTDVIINGNIKITHNGNLSHTVTGSRKITTGGGLQIKTSGINQMEGAQNQFKGPSNRMESAVTIDYDENSVVIPLPAVPGADAASAASLATNAALPLVLKVHTVADLSSQDQWKSLISKDSIMRRMPTPEPYPLHENLDPLRFKPDKLDRDKDGRYQGTTTDMKTPATFWRKYSTSTDTFAKIGPSNQG